MSSRAPILLSGICLLIWGWQHEILWLAIPMALVSEVSPLIKTRFDISRNELNLVFDMCAVFFAGLLVYGLVSASGSRAIFLLIFWLPIVLFPMLLVQRYSSQWQKIPFTAISLKARKAKQEDKSIDISFLYIGAILLSASSSQITPIFFYLCLCCVFFVAIWKLRGRYFPKWAFIACFPLAAGGGYIIDTGIIQTQLYLEEHLGRLFLDWFTKDNDPFSRDTRLGSIGSLKGSGRIIYRLETIGNYPPPKLIRDGSFDLLIGNDWSASEIVFSRAKTNNMLDWRLTTKNAQNPASALVKISGYFDDNAILVAPIGTQSMSNIPAEKLEHTRLGTIKASEIPEMLVYIAEYSVNGEYSYPPKSHDLQIPDHYTNYLEDITSTLKLEQHSPESKLIELQRFFLHNFSYTLDLDTTDTRLPPIIDFLTNTKSGHCEYFASATVLMLRKLGIPARYATGFSIQEYDDFEQAWIARKYHAHAWALAYIDGRWVNVDNTPPNWVVEDKEEGVLLGIYNALSWARYAYNKWRMGNQEIVPDSYIYTIAAILAVFIGYRIRKRRLQKTAPPTTAVNKSADFSNPWIQFFKTVEMHTVERREHETLFDWYNQCSTTLDEKSAVQLREIIRAYYRWRFDPGVDKNGLRKHIGELVDNF